MALQLKPEYAGLVIGFRDKSLPLGQRSEADLLFLYERAKSRNNKAWLNMFEEKTIPTKKEIDSVKEASFYKKVDEKNKKDISDNTIG